MMGELLLLGWLMGLLLMACGDDHAGASAHPTSTRRTA
jgi:hypothetical protein